IVAVDVALGNAATVTVTAIDAGGVEWVSFWVYPDEYPAGWDDGWPVAGINTFGDEATLTFTPGWTGTYTVQAWACDNLGNRTPHATPLEATFVVS
ncbi:unnamed protein product, partial [marine sediment metagenome]